MTFYISLPISWVRHHSLHKNSSIKIIVGENGELILKPIKQEGENES
jgi:hypothetical protein